MTFFRRFCQLAIAVMLCPLLDTPPVLAQTSLPAAVIGTGTVFNVTDSEYLNVTVHSTEEVELALQSLPHVITIAIRPAAAASTQLTLSGLAALHTYYKYENDLSQVTKFQTDENGAYTYVQDLSQPHLILIQEGKSTLFITDTAGGGDCAAIGNWDEASKTCTLTADVSQTIQVNSPSVTLDGAGYTLAPAIMGTPLGVFVPQSNVTIKNLTIRDFVIAVALYDADQSLVTNTTITNNYYGIHGVYTDSATIRGNTIKSNLGDPKLGMEFFWSSHNTIVGNTIINVFGGIQLFVGNVNNTLTHNSITSLNTGLYINQLSNHNSIYSNDITAPANPHPAYVDQSSGNVFNVAAPIGGNYWSVFDTPGEGCVNANHDDFCDAPFLFYGGQDDLPRIKPITQIPTEPPVVAFIPGLQGSRLYTQGPLFENKLWEPNRNTDVEKLFLDTNGASVNEGIYTRDMIDEAFGHNIYKTFISFMDDMVARGSIAAWQAFPYDWRLNNEAHIAAVMTQLEQLAAAHENSQLTMIAHSNGGLLAQALLQELERQHTAGQNDLINKLDRLILVASPQLGTPKAIPSLLHGYGQDIAKGFILNTTVARELAEHMQSAFTLLPSDNYFDVVTDPVIQFDSSVNLFAPFTDTYGPDINSAAELRQFLAGENGARSEPTAGDTVSPNVLSTVFLNGAAQIQTALAAWTPPEHIKVIQIAGWGLDTIKAIRYEAKPSFFCGDTSPFFCKDGYKLDVRPVFTSDGDGSVVIPSSVVKGGEIYYLNLFLRNQDQFINTISDRDHADILEVQEINELFKNILENIEGNLPQYIKMTKPESDEDSKKLRVSVHSPVVIHAYDENGKHTGPILNPDPNLDLTRIEENIPNSYYLELGEGKYIGFGSGSQHKLVMQGAGIGTFTLEIEEVQGDEVVNTLTFADIPVSLASTAEIDISMIETASDLRINIDGQGEAEFSLSALEEPTPMMLLDMLEQAIRSLDLRHGPAQSTASHLKNARKFIDKGKVKQAVSQLDNIKDTLLREINRGITAEQVYGAVEMIERIKVVL